MRSLWDSYFMAATMRTRILVCLVFCLAALGPAAINLGSDEQASAIPDEQTLTTLQSASDSIAETTTTEPPIVQAVDSPVPETTTSAPATTAPPEFPASSTAPKVSPPIFPAPATPTFTSINDSVVGTGLNEIRYSGAWEVVQRAGKFQNDDHHSEEAGDSFSMTFSGTGVVLFGSKDVQHGKALVRIDNEPVAVVDYFGSNRADNVELFRKTGLTDARHTISVIVLGENSTGSDRFVVTVDRLAVIS